MSNEEVYFSNHDKALRFPWSIYHKPLIDDLELFLKSFINEGSKVLVIGPGDFKEFSLLQSLGARVSILDIDDRVLDTLRARHNNGIEGYYLVDENFVGYPPPESFDLIYAKEVIEHLIEYHQFLRMINDVLKQSGKIWISTPNYGYFLLPLLENTVLELVARFSGFSRKDIHPSKFNETLLNKAISEAGFETIKSHVTKFRLALTITAKKTDLKVGMK